MAQITRARLAARLVSAGRRPRRTLAAPGAAEGRTWPEAVPRLRDAAPVLPEAAAPRLAPPLAAPAGRPPAGSLRVAEPPAGRARAPEERGPSPRPPPPADRAERGPPE